jgi:Fe-S oxidoreductase
LPVAVAREDEPIELLYWVGCAGSFDPDGQPVARAMIKIMNHLGINYRVLGTRERCTGDPARRMGEEGLFQELARGNLAMLAPHQVTRIVTHCPHCYNTWRNEYPHIERGTTAAQRSPEVLHHSEFLAELVASGRIPRHAAAPGERATFHDPCYMARGNGVVEPPRAVATAIGAQLAEMPRRAQNSFCCGAGGGSMWLDVRGNERIENLRFREAAATGAETLVTACPFCKTMLEAARTAQAGDAPASLRRVKDLAELVAESLGL